MTTKLIRNNLTDQVSRSDNLTPQEQQQFEDLNFSVKKRHIMTVRIRGIAFKAAIGSARAQLLGELQHLADDGKPPLLLTASVAMLFGWGFGILSAWWFL